MELSGLTNGDVASIANTIVGSVIVNPSQVSLLKNSRLQDPGCRVFKAVLTVHRAFYDKAELPEPLRAKAAQLVPIPGCDATTTMEDIISWFYGWIPMPEAVSQASKEHDSNDLCDGTDESLNESIRRALMTTAIAYKGASNPQEALMGAYPMKDTRRRGAFQRWLKGEDWTPDALEAEAFCLARIIADISGDQSPLVDPIAWLAELAIAASAAP